MRSFNLGLALVLFGCGAGQDPAPDDSSAGTTNNGGAGVTAPTSSGGAQNGGQNGGSGGSAGGVGIGGSGGQSGAASSAGGGGSRNDGGPVVFTPPTCAKGSTTLPPDAPVLTPGVWKPINPAAVTFGQHGAGGDQDVFTQGMTIDPCNAATLYLTACTNPVTGTSVAVPGLYRSTNAGTTWTKLGPFDGPINIKIDPKDPLHMYVVQGVRGQGIGFWVSKDGGSTWVTPDGFTKAAQIVHDTDTYHVEPDPTDFNHVLLSFHYYWYNGDTAGVFESFDGGNTFIIHDPIPGLHGAGGYGVFFLYNPALGIGDNKTWLYGTQGAGYYRTTDAGTTWTKVTDNSMDHGGGQLYYTKSGALYAGGVPHLMKSTDNGATWTFGGNPNKSNWGYIGIVGDGTHLYTSAHDHNGEFQTSLESDGITWTDFSTQISHAGAFEMAYDAANGIVYSANEYDGLLALKVKP